MIALVSVWRATDARGCNKVEADRTWHVSYALLGFHIVSELVFSILAALVACALVGLYVRALSV